MTKRQGKKSRPPHFRVCARIGVSRLHGVGVFAIRSIKKGKYIFYGDDEEIVWVKKRNLGRLQREIRKLYQDFCIIKNKGTLYGCPKNFNLLTVAWYLNESKKPNVACDQDYRFFALRNIKKGEELTVDYQTYNEFK